MNNTADRLALRRTILGVLAGGGTLVGIMVVLAGVAVAFGLVRVSDAGRWSLGPWLALEIIGGAGASALGGAVSRRIARSYRAPAILAVVVSCIGLFEATTILRYATAESVDAPRWLVILAPLVAGAGVLLGGWRPAKSSHRSAGGTRVVAGTDALRYALPVAVLAAAAALSVFVLPDVGGDTESRVMASALALDFTVSVPVLVWFLLVRARRIARIAVVPVFVVGYSLAVATIPAEHDAVLKAVQLLAVPLEVALVIYLAVLTRRAWADAPGGAGDFATRFRSTARRVIGSRIPADILTTEVTILYYALRRRNPAKETATSFTMHRRAGYLSVMLGLTMVLLVETAAVHMLLGLWSNTAAWILTGLSGYALVWLAGDYRAIVARPIRITATHLQIRLGVRWEADIPHRNIDHAGLLQSPMGKPTGETLVVALLGQPNLTIKLIEPVEVRGMYGVRRRVTELRVRVDEPTKLCAALSPGGS